MTWLAAFVIIFCMKVSEDYSCMWYMICALGWEMRQIITIIIIQWITRYYYLFSVKAETSC